MCWWCEIRGGGFHAEEVAEPEGAGGPGPDAPDTLDETPPEDTP